jgi:NADH:ubiquinone oxidoreductase subunit 6 (subunit J)
MTTWTLWIGALLVLTGSAALLTRRTGAARLLWLLATLAFAAAFVGVVTADMISVPLVLAVVVAIVVTLLLVTITRPAARDAGAQGVELMEEWILWGLNVAALVVLLAWMVRSLWVRRSRRQLFDRGRDHLADGGPYVTFGFHEGPIEVHTQDGDVISTLPLGSGPTRLVDATRVLNQHGWRKVGALVMSDPDTLFVPVAHHPVRKLPSPNAQGEL